MITKSYTEGVKARVELVRQAYSENYNVPFHTLQLLDYLEGLDYFVEEKKLRCEICKNPLYERQDGSLTCIEMHH